MTFNFLEEGWESHSVEIRIFVSKFIHSSLSYRGDDIQGGNQVMDMINDYISPLSGEWHRVSQ